jgi:cytochrome c peroxidase
MAQFMRSMVSFDSRFDHAAAKEPDKAMSGDFEMFSPEENQGKSLFFNGVGGIAEFGCAVCHLPPTFGMAASANNGLDVVYQDNGLGELGRPSNDPLTPSNDGKFKAPSLRNVELTAPYMHDGRFETLEEVVEHYSAGVHPHANLGLAFEDQSDAGPTGGFGLTLIQKSALVAFLRTLTDRQFTTDVRFSDPFVRTEP